MRWPPTVARARRAISISGCGRLARTQTASGRLSHELELLWARSPGDESEFGGRDPVAGFVGSRILGSMNILLAPSPMKTLPPPDTMYRALLARDTSYDGVFLAAIKTTGIFCRPGCGAKKPKRENVEFFASAED